MVVLHVLGWDRVMADCSFALEREEEVLRGHCHVQLKGVVAVLYSLVLEGLEGEKMV